MKGLFSQSFDKLEIFPIGSIYTSINSTSPAILFGGTWEQIEGRFLLSASSSYAAGGTGGASTVNLSHTHSTANHTLTVNEIPSHYHLTYIDQNYSAYPAGNTNSWKQALVNASNHATTSGYYDYPAGGGAAHNHGNTGSNLSSSQSIMPPYLTVYMWKRMA